MENFRATKAEERERETGNLRAFVQEYVRPEKGGFVVAADLIKAYTSWRQARQPTMQLHYLYQAETDATDLMKAYEWHTELVVKDGEKAGTVDRAWKDATFTFPGGNTTHPTPLPAPVEAELPEEEEGPEGAPADAPATTYCFHYHGAYAREPLNAFLRARVFPAPADAEALDAKLAASVQGMGAALKGLGTPWTMRTVQHEGLRFNVYLAGPGAGAAGEGGGAGDGDRDVQ